MGRIEPVLTTEQAIAFITPIRHALSHKLKAKGFLLGVLEIAKRPQGQFVVIPGARWYVLKGTAGHYDTKRVIAFDKEFAAYIGADTNREDVEEMTTELAKEIEDNFHATKEKFVVEDYTIGVDHGMGEEASEVG